MADETPRCGARRTNGDGTTCQNPAGYMTPHPGRGPCRHHMGCTPMVVQKYVVEECIENAHSNGANWRGDPIEIGPHEALLEEVRRTAGRVRYYQSTLDYAIDLDEDGATKIRNEFMTERRHLVTVCGVAARAGVEERAIQLAERWGEEIASVMGRIFAELMLTAEQRERAPEIVSRHLQLMEAV